VKETDECLIGLINNEMAIGNENVDKIDGLIESKFRQLEEENGVVQSNQI